MTRKSLPFTLSALLLLPALALGGWAVVTVEDLPDYVVAGKPLTLTFTVRQHGRTPLSGLSPRVEATSAGLEAKAEAVARGPVGQYQATLTLPQPGSWIITVHSGFGASKATLLPLPAVASGSQPAVALSEPERGARLFAAKGCVTCHVQIAIGPDLSDKRFDPEFLRRFLADPSILPPSAGTTFGMPNLNLKPAEIASLVAYLNTERHAQAR